MASHHHVLFLQLLCNLRKTSVFLGRQILLDREELTSLAELPDTSIQVLEKNAQDPSMKAM